MDIKFTIEKFDNGITLRAEGTAIVIPDHSVLWRLWWRLWRLWWRLWLWKWRLQQNMEIGRIIMKDVTASMNNTKKVVLTIKTK
jgi:hypothetical protein